MPTRVLVLFAHPAYQRSKANRALLDQARGVDGITVHDLYEEYPDLMIDVEREQELLRTHDTFVFQHPFYWYSAPAIVKEWLDLVLEWGFAYGEGGTALAGKIALTAITTGGTRENYTRAGSNFFSIRELLAPFEQTARLCGMTWLAPFVAFGAYQLPPPELLATAELYGTVLKSLRDETLDLSLASSATLLNDILTPQPPPST